MDTPDPSSGDVTLVETPRPHGLEDPRIGTVVADRYRITSRLAAGGMGIVYRAERVGLGRPVAIKFLRAHAVHDSDTRARFAAEARAASRLAHPNCVGVFDAGLAGEVPFIVMELVVGQTLRQLLDTGPLSVPRALELVRQILAGLAHAHAHGVVHRDIKPDNILVSDETGHAQIGDFGLAKCSDALAISHEVMIGTPNYMSPEQTLGVRADARADVYSTGIVLFEMLSRQRPFYGRKVFDTLRAHREAPVPSFEDIAPDRGVSPAIEAVVRRALAKAPRDRYASAAEFLAALDEATEAARSETDLSVEELLHAAGKPRWARTFGVAALLSSVVVAIAYL